jgi:glyoxylase-like metal-dependent hydrolase (beta-lactamase superfamily II)/rhodanese-related sulfurtransferase
MDIDPTQLYAMLKSGNPARLLDVRNETEFRRWKVEGPAPVQALNVPYFEFIERDTEAIDRVRRWAGDGPGEIVVVCAKGESSAFVADLLREQGFAARSLLGGMAAWGEAVAFTPLPLPEGLQAWQGLRFGKGCLTYVIADGRSAVIVDPHRRVDEYLAFLKERGLTLAAIVDTHLQADHISGGSDLQRRTGAPYHGHPADFTSPSFPMVPVTDGSTIRLGRLEMRAVECVHTPGHTPGSTSLLVLGRLLLTGDTLFVESVGRPDLGGHAAEWGRALYRSLHDRLGRLPDDTLILPAHSGGPGEVGADGIVGARLGDLRRDNDSMRLDEDAFIGRILSGIPAAPPHYDRIRRINMGLAPPSPEEAAEMELGRNECALSGRR